MSFDLRTISLGAGVQSTTLYLMAVEGELTPMPDMAIFADTQSEPQYVYDHLDYLQRTFGSVIPIKVATRGSLRDAIERSSHESAGRFASVPFWVEGSDGREAPGRRQCTREFKIDVVKAAVREALGLKPGQRASGRYHVEEWVGISMDEAHRAKPSRYPWITTRWPLLYDVPMRRSQCIDWMRERGYPLPGKSACTFCPYRNLSEWREMRDRHPEAFEDACQVDEMIRSRGPLRGMKRLQYVHRSLRPLREVVDDPMEEETLDLFGNECEGMCGV